MPDTIDGLVRHRVSSGRGQTDGDRSRLPAELPRTRDAAHRIWPRVSSEAGVGKGTRVGLIMPNGVRWVQIAIALTRIGAVLVPLSTLLPARELLAQLRTASVQFLISVEEFRGHRYLDDLASVVESQRSLRNIALPRTSCAAPGVDGR